MPIDMHLGLNWGVIAQWLRPSPYWFFITDILALGTVGMVKLNLVTKLINQATLPLWDFSNQTPKLYLHGTALTGLAGVLTRKTFNLLFLFFCPFDMALDNDFV